MKAMPNFNVENTELTSAVPEKRTSRAPYIALWCVYYGYAMLFATWFAFFDVPQSSPEVFWYHTALHGSLLLFVLISALLLKRNRQLLVGRISTIALTAVMAFSCGFPQLRESVVYACFTGALFGVICYEVLYQFCFILNGKERFIAILVSNSVLCVLGLIPTFITRRSLYFYIVITVFTAVCAVLQFFLKKQAYDEKSEEIVFAPFALKRFKFEAALGLFGSVFSTGVVMLVMNMVVKQYGFGLLWMFSIGGAAGCGAFALIRYLSDRYSEIGINLTFAATIVCAASSLIVPDTVSTMVCTFAGGVAFIVGMLCAYTLIGDTAQNYRSQIYLKWIIGIVGVLGGIGAPLIVALAVWKGNAELILAIAVISSVLLLAALVISPILFKKFFQKEQPKAEAAPLPSEAENDAQAKMEAYNFSARERDVLDLLLKGMTMREISSELNISTATVNTYCTQIYRKCGVNSRAQLILLFK